jgi:murein DD-endopeptidase MepM/ murein hydrolase activator NlpD
VVATVSLTFDLLQNLRLTDSVPVLRTVAAGSSLVLTRLARIDSLASVDAHPLVQIDLGSDSTRPDPDILYAMPFGGSEPRNLVAGFGSPTHLAENFYSLDFAMPEGTPVLAARGGVVVIVQDGYTEGGLQADLIEKSNLVVVVHSDGTLGSYGHLKPGLAVVAGDSVSEGQRLGFSGSTGFSGMPHLHFHVGKRMTGGEGRTIRVRFKDSTGGVLELIEGAPYPPADSTGPVRLRP